MHFFHKTKKESMEDTEKKKNTSKIVWGIVLGVVSVILCYMFVVIHFFFFAPNNIALKLKLWPFVSNSTLGDIYLDATVEIDFTATEDFETDIEQTSVGVNVREDGYVLAPYSDFLLWDGKEITICTNSGKVYAADIIFTEKNYNIAVLKCKNTNEDDKSNVRIPFVSLSTGTLLKNQVLAVSSPKDSKNVWTGEIQETLTNVYVESEKEGFTAVETIMENCNVLELYYSNTAFENGAVFDKTGNLIGLSLGQSFDEETGLFENDVLPMTPARLFLDEVVADYKKSEQFANKLVDSFVGLDFTEVYCHMLTSSKAENGRKDFFYFKDKWVSYTEGLYNFCNNSDLGFYLFEDLNYGEEKIEKDNLITKVEYGGNSYDIVNKIDLFNLLYSMKSGQSAIFHFCSMLDASGTENSVTIQI